jgi:hypothetical protein
VFSASTAPRHSEEEQPDFRAYFPPTARKSGDLATTRNLGAGTADTSVWFFREFLAGYQRNHLKLFVTKRLEPSLSYG